MEVTKVMTIDMTFERREELIRIEEREYGRAQGKEQTTISDIRNLMKNMNLTAEQAMNAFGINTEDRDRLMAKIV